MHNLIRRTIVLRINLCTRKCYFLPELASKSSTQIHYLKKQLIRVCTKMNSVLDFCYITLPKFFVKFFCHFNKNFYLCLSKAEEKCGSLKLFFAASKRPNYIKAKNNIPMNWFHAYDVGSGV